MKAKLFGASTLMSLFVTTDTLHAATVMRIIVFTIVGFVASLTNFPAKANIITFSVLGHVTECNSPCIYNSTGQISITYDTSVAGVVDPQGKTYSNAVSDIVIGSSHFISPVTTTHIVNDVYNNVGFVDLFYVSFSQGEYSGLVSLDGFDYTKPSTFLTSADFPESLDASLLTNFGGLVYRPSDNFRIEAVGGGAGTPLPATLPLFATGLGALGLVGWRRKRKAQAASA